MNSRPLRMTQKFDLVAAIRLDLVMERRRKQRLPQVSPAIAKSVLWALANRSDADGVCFPRLDVLSKESCVPARTLQRVLEVLSGCGYVEIERRSTIAGNPKARSTNRYRILWSAFAADGSDGGTGAAAAPDSINEGTGAALAPDPPEHAPSEREQAPLRRGTGAKSCGCKENLPLNRPQEPPPQPPAGGTQGAGAADSPPEPGDELLLIRDQAARIADAYPPTTNTLRDADIAAAIAAIQAEFTTAERVDWREMLAAASAVHRHPPKSPLWCRTWLRQRGYLDHALRARKAAARAAELATGHVPPSERHAARRQAERRAVADHAERTAILSELADDEIERLRGEVIADLPDGSVLARTFRRADPRRHPMLAIEIAQRARSPAGIAGR